MTTSPLDLPILIESERAEQLIGDELILLDMADALIDQGDTRLVVHLDAVRLAEELQFVHESDSPADEVLHLAAEQLKLYHLDAIARAVELPDPIEIPEP